MVRFARPRWLLVSLLFLGLPLSAADAQSDGWTNEVAKRLFDEGVRLASAGRWPDALDRFRHSARLVPRASTSYNIANALYRLDRPTEAIKELDESKDLVDPTDRAVWQRRDQLRSLAKAQLAVVRLRLKPPNAKLFLDGVIVPGAGSPRMLRLDPGRYALRLTEEGYAPREETLVLRPGARTNRSLVLEPIHDAEPMPAVVPTPLSSLEEVPPPQEPSEQRRFVKSPGFWALIGVLAAAGIGAGVAVIVVRSNDSPECGTTGACATALSSGAFSF